MTTLSERASRRSDSVRARRSRRVNKRATKSANQRRSTFNREMPPMVVRGGMVRTPTSKGKPRKESRRRFNLALNTAGAELRLPALPTLNFEWRMVSGGLVVALLAALYFVTTASFLQVSQAEIIGINRLSSREVNQVLGVAGSSIFTVDPAAVLTAVKENFPELTNPSVRVSLPAGVRIEVGERQPLLAWEQESIFYWVDADGVAFLPRGEAEGLVSVEASSAPDLVLNESNQTDRLISPAMVQAILALSEDAPEGTKIAYDPMHGLGWYDQRGWQVFFGLQATDMQQRLSMYRSIVEELDSRGVQPSLISVEHLHAPYYR